MARYFLSGLLPEFASFFHLPDISLVKIHSIYFYRGAVLLSQLLYYRIISNELGLDALGIFAKFLAISFLLAALFRFGGHVAISHVILSTEMPREKHKAIGFSYAVTAVMCSLLILVPVMLPSLLFFEQSLIVLLLAVLYTLNTSCSFLERAMGVHHMMVLLDAGSAYLILLAIYYGFHYMPDSVMAVIQLVVLIEALKLSVYMALNGHLFDRSLFDMNYVRFDYRVRYAINDALSVASINGMHIFFPVLLGATSAGAFFIIQKLCFPLQFVLNSVNSIIVSRIVREKQGQVRRIFFSSVKELLLLGTTILATLAIFSTYILGYFDVADYQAEFFLVLGGVFLNLTTGASAPVFNNIGAPVYNFLANFGFLLIFALGILAFHLLFNVNLRSACAILLVASFARSLITITCLRRLANKNLF